MTFDPTRQRTNIIPLYYKGEEVGLSFYLQDEFGSFSWTQQQLMVPGFELFLGILVLISTLGITLRNRKESIPNYSNVVVDTMRINKG